MTDTKKAVEQFAALFAAVQKLAEIEDVKKAEQDAKAQLKKAKDELDHYLAQREQQAKAQNKEAEAELARKARDGEATIQAARDKLEKDTAEERRKLHLASERLKTEQDVWANGRAAREQAIGTLDQQFANRQHEIAEQARALTELRGQVADEQRRLEETRKALQKLRTTLAA
jgi:hypothetical protein